MANNEVKLSVVELLRYMAGGIGFLLFIGIIAWCDIETKRISNSIVTPELCQLCKEKCK